MKIVVYIVEKRKENEIQGHLISYPVIDGSGITVNGSIDCRHLLVGGNYLQLQMDVICFKLLY